MANLKTNYVDDLLDTTKNQLRKYQQIQNNDGTVSFVDVTEYTQVGTSFGAKDINDTNAAINDVNGKLNHVYGKVVLSNPFVVWTTNSLIKFNGIVICSLSFTSTSNLITNTEIKVGNVPDLFKPLSRQSASSSDGCIFAIDTNGNISYVPNTAKPYSSIAIVYVTDYL